MARLSGRGRQVKKIREKKKKRDMQTLAVFNVHAAKPLAAVLRTLTYNVFSKL